jgi:PTH1 family peptidyl-tRNA hydrolase
MQALLDRLRPQPSQVSDAGAVTLLVGLGNPGREYANTRHNAGFQVINQLAEQHGLGFSRKHNNALIAAGHVANTRFVLAKPQTWMNESGRAVAALARFYKVGPQRILVIYDDLDLPVGAIRLRPEGGSGGHKGIKSIIEKLGTQDFPRLRVGIGRPPGRMDPVDYVLQPFSRDEMDIIEEARQRAVEAIQVFLKDGMAAAMNVFNVTA